MLTVTQAGADAILPRANTQIVGLKAQATRMSVPILIAGVSTLGIAGACFSEYYSAGVGFHAAFPVKTNGQSLADELVSLRLPIIFCLLAGDAILQVVPNRAKAALDGLMHGIGVWAILLLLFGVGAFMFSATFLTLGSAEDVGFASSFVGWALAIASASMFAISFLASHALLGKLFGVVPTIATGWRERAAIKAGERLIREVEADQTRAESIRSTVTEMEKPNALKRKAANEAGSITGKYIAEAHDMVASRKVRGDVELGPDDRSDTPDVPLAALEERYAELKQYSADHFYSLLLKQKES